TFSSYTSFVLHVSATTLIYPLSLHDALPISRRLPPWRRRRWSLCRAFQTSLSQHGRREASTCLMSPLPAARAAARRLSFEGNGRSEEHTSELQSRFDLVCRLLLEKKKKTALH